MNTDVNNINSDATAEKTKSGSGKWWLFGGCGCLMVLLLCGGGIAIVAMPAMSVFQIMAEAQTQAQESERVQEALGTPIDFGPPAQTSSGQQITFSIPISGPDGQGTLRVEAKVNGLTDIQTTVSKVELDDGTEIDLLSDAEDISLDIDDGL